MFSEVHTGWIDKIGLAVFRAERLHPARNLCPATPPPAPPSASSLFALPASVRDGPFCLLPRPTLKGSKDDSPPESKKAPAAAAGPSAPAESLEGRFATRVRPFLETYCFSCHGPKKQKADLDLSRYGDATAIAADAGRLDLILKRLQAEEMPPERAPATQAGRARRGGRLDSRLARPGKAAQRRRPRSGSGPPAEQRRVRLHDPRPDGRRHAADARVPRRSGRTRPGSTTPDESLAMSPALLKKYLAAARLIADHARPDAGQISSLPPSGGHRHRPRQVLRRPLTPPSTNSSARTNPTCSPPSSGQSTGRSRPVIG